MNMAPVDDENFIVDEYDNPVRYDDEDMSDNADADNKRRSNIGGMGKSFKNMLSANAQRKQPKGISAKMVKDKQNAIQGMFDQFL